MASLTGATGMTLCGEFQPIAREYNPIPGLCQIPANTAKAAIAAAQLDRPSRAALAWPDDVALTGKDGGCHAEQ